MPQVINAWLPGAGGAPSGPIAIRGIGTAALVGGGFTTVNHTLPAYSAGDYVFLQCNYATAGGAAGVATPSGWTKLIDGSHAGPAGTTDKYYLFYKKMDGSEGSTVTLTQTGSAGAGNIFQAQSVAIQGVKSSGTFYESLFHYQNRHYSSPARGLSLQAHGANRIALHFYFGGFGTTNAIAPAADDFTDLYAVHENTGSRSFIGCSYRDIAAAELTTTEQRTGNNSRWAVVSLVVIAGSETAGTPLARPYWRVRGLAQYSTADNGPMSAAELEWRRTPAGADISTVGQAIADSEFSGAWVKGQAYNNNASDAWGSAAGTYYNHYCGQQFPVDEQISELYYVARNDGADFGQAPKDGLIEASPDGVKWEGRRFFADLVWSLGGANTLSIP